MVTGETLIRPNNAVSMMRAHIYARPSKIRDLAPELDVPDELEEIVRRGLAKLPANRIPSAAAYLKLLDDLPAPSAEAPG